MQTFDYIDRRTSMNRKQMVVNKDGSFEIVLSHANPGSAKHPNWLDTMGRQGGTVFWRFLLPEGDVLRPTATVVKFTSLLE